MEILWIPQRRNAVLASAIASIGAFGLGTVEVWAAVTLKELDEVEHFGPLLDNQKSWIASIAYLGALVAAPSSGYLISSLGRKKSMIALSLPFVFGWLLVVFAKNLPMLYIGRFVTGFCGGSFTVSIPAYVSEITEDRSRGALGAIMVVMINFGILFIYLLGAFLNWFWLSIVCAAIPVLFICSMFFMPESPRHLLANGKTAEATKSLQWLRGAPAEKFVLEEIFQIQDSIHSGTGQSALTISELICSSVLKPIGISVCLMAFGQFSGVTGVLLYTVQVFEEAGTEMDGINASIIIGGCQLITVIMVPCLLVDKLGRKVLLLISELVLIIGLVSLGTFYFLKDVQGSSMESMGWLPLTSLIVIIMGYNAGVGCLPWVISSELLPHHLRELGASIINISYWALAFTAGLTFQDLGNLLENYGLYWLCAGICTVGSIFVIFCVPETKGKTQEQIAEFFKKRSDSESNEEDDLSLSKSTTSTTKIIDNCVCISISKIPHH